MYIHVYNGLYQIGHPFLNFLVFVICFVFYGYCILVFDLLRKVTYIHIFSSSRN